MQIKQILKKAALTILPILILQSSFCQENYMSGSLIDLNGDSIMGYIDYQNWRRNPDKINFMHKTDSIRFTLTPMDIKEFTVSDENYVSSVIKTEISPDEADKLSYNNELKLEIDTVFLQVMIKGKKSLYFCENRYGKEQCYFKTDSSYELLVYKRYLKKQNGNNLIIENELYKGQLSAYLQDCPEIQAKLRNAQYNKMSMEKLFDFYYTKTESEINFQKSTEKLKAEFGVLAGATISTLKFHTYNFPYLENIDYGQSLNFSTGLFFDFISPRDNGKLSISNELIYTSFKLDGQTTDNFNNTIYTKFAYSYIKLNNLFRYKFPQGKSSMFLNAGLSNGIALKEINIKTVGSETSKALDFTRKHEQGLLFGGGIKNNKLSYELRFERGNGMSTIANTGSKTNRYSFIIAYRF